MSNFLEETIPLIVADRPEELVVQHRTTTAACPILIIDDDPDILRLLAWTLEDEGYTVAAVTSGREALQWIHAAEAVGESPALILLDLAMPGMSGPQLAAALRQKWGEEVSPIIVISATPSADRHGQEIGAAFTLIKPFEVDTLLQLVKQFAVQT